PAALAQKEEGKKGGPPAPQGKLSLVIDPGTHHSGVRHVFWLGDGSKKSAAEGLIASVGGDHTVRLWDPDVREQVTVIHLPGTRLRENNSGARLAPVWAKRDRIAVAAVGYDTGEQVQMIYALPLPAGELLHSLRHPDVPAPTLSFGPNGRRLATASS